MKFRNQTGGFTIVELLVVIVVIAILVALTLPNLFGLQRRARGDTRKNDLKNIQQELETSYNDNSRYPAAVTGLTGFTAPTAPSTDASYTYSPAPGGCNDTGTNCTSFTLAANLENTNDQSEVNGVY